MQMKNDSFAAATILKATILIWFARPGACPGRED
jgi:hypothetical protein